MSDVLVTTTDIGKFVGSDYGDLFVTAQNFAPELDLIAKVSSNSKTYVRPYVSAGAAPAFRAVNAGVEYTSGTVDNESVTLKILTDFMAVDGASMSEQELAQQMQIQLQAAVQKFRQSLGAQIIYGTGNDATGFSGIVDQIDDDYVVDASGDTVDTCTSAYVVNLNAINGLQLVFEDAINITDYYEATITQSSKRFRGYEAVIEAVVGLSLGVDGNVVRIANIDASNKLTDALVAQALVKMPDEVVANNEIAILCNGTAIAGLQSSRTATTASGLSVPLPVESSGVKIVRTGSVSATEAVWTEST